MRHGGKILIDQLAAQGVRTIFTVPGESFLPVLDGLFEEPRIRTITCRHEGGATMMAEAWGKLTGTPGVAFVTRGPGAANAMSGLHVAEQDQTPVVLFIGLPPSNHEDRKAFQEIDVKRLLSSFVKWAGVIRAAERIPEYVSRAFHLAASGRPGPVVIGLPEDVLSARIAVRDAGAVEIARPMPSQAAINQLKQKLDAAERPLMIVGGSGWSQETQGAIESFADRFDLPVAAAFRHQDYVDNRHQCYVGHAGIGIEPKLAAGIRSADVLIALGTPLEEITSSRYSLVQLPDPSQFLVHISPAPDEIGQLYRSDLPIVSAAGPFAEALAVLDAPPARSRARWRKDLRAAYEASLDPIPTPGDVHLEQVVRIVSAELPENAIITNGAGNYAAFVHRYFTYKGYRTQLAPASGSMGYGLPAAIAAKLAAPGRPVIAFAGDGCFMMTVQELATAVQYGLPVVVIVADNGMYGTIRMHQEQRYPGRVLATSLVNPDFAALARSFGALGETVSHTEEFRPALQRALDCGKPAVIELKLDPEAISPKETLRQIVGRKG